MTPLTRDEKRALVEELRAIYNHCVKTGLVPSGDFVKLGQLLKAEAGRASEVPSTDTDKLYYGTPRKEIEQWLTSLESNVECEDRGGTPYSDKEKEFIEDMRSTFESRSDNNRPLSGKQLKWLQALYDRS